MILSKACDYGIRATLYIAAQSNRQFVPIREISEKLDISFHFLTKILQILTQKNILISFRGPSGGVGPAKSFDTVSLMEIIVAIDGTDIFEKCILNLEFCGDENPCPMHDKWKNVRASIVEIFENTKLDILAQRVKTQGFRLTNLIS